MINTSLKRPFEWVLLCLCLASVSVGADQSKTVIGPTNPDLQDGATALMAGDAEEGVRLTLQGLKYVGSRRDRQTALSNLCAGYAMLDQPEEALKYCDLVLEDNDGHWRAYNNRALVYVQLKRYDEAKEDLDKGQALAPNSRTLKVVRAMWRDATNPVSPNIVIDDRRSPESDDADE